MNFITIKETSSTNTYLKERIKSGEIQENTALLALSQTEGKGRLSRQWHSEKGKSLTLSVAFKSPLSPAVTLLCALGVFEALRDICEGKSLQIKWPNDIIAEGKKLCGILTQRVSDFTVVGIGLNVNNESFPEEIARKGTSLYLLTGETFSVEELAKKITDHLESTLKECDFSFSESHRNKYKSLCVNLGKEIEFGKPSEKGVAQDISSEGELIANTPQGQKAISFGDVFVSGIY